MSLTRVLVMAVPWDVDRVRSVRDIRAQVPEVEIVWDQHHSVQETFLRTLDTAGDDPVVIVQDDVVLAGQWREKVEAVIAEHPDAVCQFFSLRKADLEKGARWEPGRAYLMNQCFYLPATYARQLHAFAQTWWEANPGHTGDDTCISEWLRSRQEAYWHHVPSLVQHRDLSSVIGAGRSTRRQSPTFEQE